MNEVFAILGCYAAYVGSCFMKDQAGQEEYFFACLTLEHGTSSLSQNVGTI
jgi:hypothetical protein